MEFKKYFNKAYRLVELIECKKEELEGLRDISTSLKGIDYSADKVQTSGKSDAGYVNVLAKIADLEEIIANDLDELVQTKIKIREIINQLDDPDEVLTLSYRYINFYSWEEIADKMNVSLRTVFRFRKSAFEKLEQIYEKVGI